MLIHAEHAQYPDHPPHTSTQNPSCPYSHWFSCDSVETVYRDNPYTGKRVPVREQCPARHRVSCDRALHVPLEVAFAALEQRGWTLHTDGSGLRCPKHS